MSLVFAPNTGAQTNRSSDPRIEFDSSVNTWSHPNDNRNFSCSLEEDIVNLTDETILLASPLPNSKTPVLDIPGAPDGFPNVYLVAAGSSFRVRFYDEKTIMELTTGVNEDGVTSPEVVPISFTIFRRVDNQWVEWFVATDNESLADNRCGQIGSAPTSGAPTSGNPTTTVPPTTTTVPPTTSTVPPTTTTSTTITPTTTSTTVVPTTTTTVVVPVTTPLVSIVGPEQPVVCDPEISKFENGVCIKLDLTTEDVEVASPEGGPVENERLVALGEGSANRVPDGLAWTGISLSLMLTLAFAALGGGKLLLALVNKED